MNNTVKTIIRVLVFAFALVAIGRIISAVTASPELGVRGGRLAKCPDSSNCVSSQADPNSSQFVPAIALPGDSELTAEIFSQWVATIDSLRGSTVIEQTESYARFQFRSRVFGFVDDLEIYGEPGSQVIDIRSASRLGYSDLGVNRRRVESIRKQFSAQ